MGCPARQKTDCRIRPTGHVSFHSCGHKDISSELTGRRLFDEEEVVGVGVGVDIFHVDVWFNYIYVAVIRP